MAPDDQSLVNAIVETGASASLSIVRAAESGQVTRQSLWVNVICRDTIDHSANRVPAVEQGSGALDDFHPIKHKHIDRFNFVAGLRRDPAEPQTILHDKHAVTIESANHGTA